MVTWGVKPSFTADGDNQGRDWMGSGDTWGGAGTNGVVYTFPGNLGATEMPIPLDIVGVLNLCNTGQGDDP